jgi:hypothetical protein
MPRVAIALGLALLLAAALIWAVPFLTREQEYAAVTPQPDPLFVTAKLPLAGGEQACAEGAALDPLSEVAHLRASTPGPRPVPLELTVQGDAYSASARIPPTWRDGAPIAAPIEPPREAVMTTICVRNLGSAAVELAASDDRTNARRFVEVDGQRVPQNFVIVFSESEPRTIAERLPVSLRRASAFRPAISPVVLWPLLALFAFGVPLGVLAAYRWALRDE